MSAPILARLSASLRLVGKAGRALVSGKVEQAVTQATTLDFRAGGFFASRRMSPAEARLVLEQAAAGSLDAQWDLFALMEDTWPRLSKNLSELRRAASRATYIVNPCAERGKPATASAKERSALVDQSLRQWWPKPGTLELSFEDTLFHALDAYGKGTSALEIHWGRTPDGILPRCSHVLASRRYGWNATGTELGLVTQDGTGWQPFPPDRFLVGIWQARTGAPGATAILRCLVPYWAGITFGWEWLLSNAQIFGVPFRWATYDKNQPHLGALLRDMLAAMGASGYGAFPEGTKLEFKEAAQNATGNPQVVVQELADKACDLLILGQELSGAAQKAGLGGGAAGLQGSVRADRLQGAAQWCADLLNYQLVPAILRANWGNTDEPPVIVADVDDEPDPLKLAERDKVLLDAGIELPRAWFYDRHGIPVPVDGEAVIVGRAPVAAGPGVPSAAPGGQSRPPVMAKQLLAADRESDAIYTAEAVREAAPAVRGVVEPILRRLAAISDIPDEADQRAALAQFRAALPVLAREALARVPAAAPAFERILAPAFLTGFAEAAAVRSLSQTANRNP